MRRGSIPVLLGASLKPERAIVPIVRHQDRSEQGPFDSASGSEAMRCDAGHSHPGDQRSGETVMQALPSNPDATTINVVADEPMQVLPGAVHDHTIYVGVNPHGLPIGLWGLDLRCVQGNLNRC